MKEKNSKEKKDVLSGEDTNYENYLKEIRKIVKLTQEETVKEIIELKKGKTEAKRKIINSYLYLLENIPNRYRGQGLPDEDLFQEGYWGLEYAVENYDYSKGKSFVTYATEMINYKRIEALTKESSQRKGISKDAVKDILDIKKVENELRQEKMREPTREEVAEKMGISTKLLEKKLIMRSDTNRVSLDEPINPTDEEERTFSDTYSIHSKDYDLFADMITNEELNLDELQHKHRICISEKERVALQKNNKTDFYTQLYTMMAVHKAESVRGNKLHKIIKRRSSTKAYILGHENFVLKYLMEKSEPKIVDLGKGKYEVFSTESVNGKGQIAEKGDYIKIDANNNPYPIKKSIFESKYRHLSEDLYEEKTEIIYAWDKNLKMCEEIEFLKNEKGLIINKESKEKYYTAELWGSRLSAAQDAKIVFYKIDKDEYGEIKDIDFNFVQKEIFDKTYEIREFGR